MASVVVRLIEEYEDYHMYIMEFKHGKKREKLKEKRK